MLFLNPITITLNPYVNTQSNDIDKGMTITSHFEWTLPSGWQTSTGQSGTFVDGSSISVIPPASVSATSISVRAKANTQYSQPTTLQITRNLEDFSISGDTHVHLNSMNTYSVPSVPGVTYSWQIPPNWQSSGSTTNSIEVWAPCGIGNITCTMTGCNNQTKPSMLSIISNTLNPGTIISGPSTICSSGNTFTIENLPPVISMTWSCGPGLAITGGQNSPTCTFSVTGSAPSWVRINLLTICGENISLQKDFSWVGKPTISSITPLAYYTSGTYNDVCNLENQMTNMEINGATNVTWERIAASPETTTWYQVGNDISFYFYYPDQTSVFRITAYNGCGSTSYDFGFKSIQCGPDPCDPDYLISPNPASGDITIIPNIPPPCDTYTGVDAQISEVMIVDSQGNTKKKIKYGAKTKKVEMNISELNTGTYIVIINDGIKSVSKTLLIKK